MRARAIALIATAAIGIGACGDDEGDTASTPAEPAAAAPPAQTTPSGVDTTATTTPETSQSGGSVAGISKDLSSKPEIPKQSGKEPTKLVTKDIVVGKGRAAQAGDSLVMHYVGVLRSDGEQFDASWDSGRPFPFVLGQGNVIQGWDQGIVGMKVGGRRLLTIPPDLAYGDQGQGPIGPGATLVFVVDLLNNTPG